MGPPAERRQPLPSLFHLPAHLLGQLSPARRRAALAALVLLLAALVVTAIALAPRITESKRERAAQERRDERQAAAAERARLVREQRPRFGRVPAGIALIPGVEQAITRDARARHATGELETAVQRANCDRDRIDGKRIVLACTAVTHEVAPSAATGGALVGYPYAAAVSSATRRYAICKTSGHPGEGSFTHQDAVALPRACGG
jgi:C4-dicarboxylate-specific signal transduction histidine kinase